MVNARYFQVSQKPLVLRERENGRSEMDFKSIWEFLSNPSFVKTIFGITPSAWFTRAVQPVLIFLFTTAIVGFVWKNLHEPLKALFELFRHFRSSPTERERIRLRHQFADHVLRRIERQNEREFWHPARFTDLEADYYAGNRAGQSILTRLRSPLSFGPRRVKAIAASLVRSRDRFALIEGDPGSGKTVLFREVARRVCARAATSWKADAPVALYFDLKMLNRSDDQRIDPTLIRQFIVDQTKRFGSPEIGRFLEQNLDQGMREGWWVFLLDSFDEIPDILSAEDVSDTIDRYSEAIFGFASDFNQCRTLLATRYFRRPKDSSQPKFRVLPLSDVQRNQLIERASITPEAADRLYSGIALAGPSLRHICENPMYLALLIEYVREGAVAPNNAHELFARFVDRQINIHQELLIQFAIDAATLRAFAEAAAFQIVAKSGLGLNPPRAALLSAVGETNAQWLTASPLLDLLEDLRFARGESDADDRTLRRFTYAHRRFQEYFATCYVIRVNNAATEQDLLFDARWRETATVLLGVHAGVTANSMLTRVQQYLTNCVFTIRNRGQYQELETTIESESGLPSPAVPEFFSWPPSSLHVLSVLQDGYADDPARLASGIRYEIAGIVRSAFRRGRLEDRRMALEVAGTLPDVELTPLLRSAISFGSSMLDDIAFRQMRSLNHVPVDLSLWIRLTLIRRAARGKLVRDSRTILAFLNRLPDGGRLLSAATLLTRIGLIDDLIHVLFAVSIAALIGVPLETRIYCIGFLVISVLLRPLCLLIYLFSISMQKTGMSTRPKWAFWLPRRLPARVQQHRMFCYLFVVIYMLTFRGVIALVLYDEFTLPTDNLVLVCYSLLGAWAPMATASVIEGRFTSWRWWPMLPLLPLLEAISRPIFIARTFGHHLINHWLAYSFIVVYSLSFYLAFKKHLFHASTRALVGISSIELLPAAFLVAGAILWCLDWRRLSRVQHSASEIAPNDFPSALGAYRWNSFRVRFVRLVAGELLLPQNQQSIDMIRYLSLAIDRDISREPHDLAVETGCSSVDQWRRAYMERRWRARKIGLKLWGGAVLDALSELEQRLVERQRVAEL